MKTALNVLKCAQNRPKSGCHFLGSSNASVFKLLNPLTPNFAYQFCCVCLPGGEGVGCVFIGGIITAIPLRVWSPHDSIVRSVAVIAGNAEGVLSQACAMEMRKTGARGIRRKNTTVD
jgi:hypothetical protein